MFSDVVLISLQQSGSEGGDICVQSLSLSMSRGHPQAVRECGAVSESAWKLRKASLDVKQGLTGDAGGARMPPTGPSRVLRRKPRQAAPPHLLALANPDETMLESHLKVVPGDRHRIQVSELQSHDLRSDHDVRGAGGGNQPTRPVRSRDFQSRASAISPLRPGKATS